MLLVYAAASGEKVVISGGRRLETVPMIATFIGRSRENPCYSATRAGPSGRRRGRICTASSRIRCSWIRSRGISGSGPALRRRRSASSPGTSPTWARAPFPGTRSKIESTWRCKTKNENNHGDAEIQRIAELKKGGEYKIFFLLVFSVLSVPLW